MQNPDASGNWPRPELVDEIIPVSTADATAMARRLARCEALFAGTSTGANLVAAIDIGKRIGPYGTIVTVMCDSGIKYLSTALYGQTASGTWLSAIGMRSKKRAGWRRPVAAWPSVRAR
jgi:hypothetical protein